MSDIATISLRVNTSDLERGNQALDDFQKAAGTAAKKSDDLNASFRSGNGGAKQAADGLREQKRELQDLLNKISPVNRALNELDSIQESLSKFRNKGLVGDEDFGRYNGVLEATRSKLAQVLESETAEGRARQELARETERAAAANDRFLKSLTDQAATFRGSNADIAEYRAAQMGIAEQAAPIIAQMRQQETALKVEAEQRRIVKQAIVEMEAAERAEAAEVSRAQRARESFVETLEREVNAIGKSRTELLALKAAELGVSDQSAPLIARLREQDDAWKRGEISAGQYRQAMRLLPAQITDVVTSLASGSPVWLVAIQQGGQIKDSFGGVSNATKVLLSFLNPMNVAIGLVALGFGALALKVADNRKELAESAKAVQDNIGVTGDFAEKLAVNIRNIADTSGQTADAVSKAFISTNDGAGQAVDKLIAVGVSYQDAKTRVEQYKESGDFTSLNSLIEQHKLKIAGIADQWTDAAVKVRNYYTAADKGPQGVALGGAIDGGIVAAGSAKSLLADITGAQRTYQEDVKKTAESTESLYLSLDRVASAQKNLVDAQKNLNKIRQTGDKETISQAERIVVLRQQELASAMKAQTPRSKTRDPNATQDKQDLDLQRQTLALQVQLDVMGKQQALGGVISQQRRDLLTTESEISILTEKAQKEGLNQQEQIRLAADKRTLSERETLAALGDQYEQKKRLQELDKQASKFEEQQRAKQAAIDAQASGKSSTEAQRDAERARIGEQYADNPDARDRALRAAEETYKKQDDLQSNWLAGAKSAWTEYYDTATNVYQSVHNVAASAFSGLNGMLDDLVLTGKTSFKSFAASMLKMIAQVIDQLLIAYAIQSALGWITGSSSGGSTPSGAYTGAAANLTFSGGGYTGDGGKYQPKGVVHGGEFVFTKEATSALGIDNLYSLMRSAQGYANGGYVGSAPMTGLKGGSGAAGFAPVFSTTVNIDSDGGASSKSSDGGDAMGRALAAELQNAALQVVQKQVKNGGIIYNFVKGR
ncbi:hypothetical protein WP3W18E02_19810 [Klebsiella sp. WP3-W18-ESBL-02]|uniref:phage tail tape measure protein n=1 Tax=Klebsiella sp. WP3-W18-ESBL-02 TaxID=2675710 RepID=UPI0015DD3211|nr:phage tail tape measure protein [Klebsiella sp. WP3-W18-ESBL-02]BBQ83452.1 hypothetical protein WP3W18E02_19810 [Klebsiella sp. WP3-W18-ESBL-02]